MDESTGTPVNGQDSNPVEVHAEFVREVPKTERKDKRRKERGVTEQDYQTGTDRVYVPADDVFAEIPVTTLDQLTKLAKNRFAQELMAAEQVTDKQMRVFRVSVIRDLIAQQHKALIQRVADKVEKRNRAFYKELRARGISREQAIKQSGYNPDF